MNERFTSLIIILLLFMSLRCENSKQDNQAILLAEREAPLGWIYLKMYKNKSFEFISRELRNETVYSGTYKLSADTIFFNYKDSIPRAGKTAIVSDKTVSYIDGSYPENVEIKLNELTK